MTLNLALIEVNDDGDGEVVDDLVVEGIDEYNLDKPFARADIIDQIKSSIRCVTGNYDT